MMTEEVTHRVTIECYTSRSTGAGPGPVLAGTDPPGKKKAGRECWKERIDFSSRIWAGIGGIAAVITLLILVFH